MNTLPPIPSFNPHIPIISSSGGTAAAYKDPNSPESIMKKTTLVQAQAAVDSTYDVDLAKVEGFTDKSEFASYVYFFAVLLLVCFVFKIKLRRAKIYLFLLALAITVFFYSQRF
jgi:hypothetical protein